MTDSYVGEAEMEAIRQKLESGEALSAKEKASLMTYQSEMAAYMTENLLGNERFIERLVRADRGFVGRFLNKLQSLGEFFKNIGNAEAK